MKPKPKTKKTPKKAAESYKFYSDGGIVLTLDGRETINTLLAKGIKVSFVERNIRKERDEAFERVLSLTRENEQIRQRLEQIDNLLDECIAVHNAERGK